MAQRIALSGSAGVGKTTLARRLAAELGVPYIPEGMREYIESGGVDLHELGHDGMRELVVRLWEDRKRAELEAGSFVADRSSYDFAAFWLFYGFARMGDEVTDRFMAETMAPGRYDQVIVLQQGGVPFVADGVRSSNPWTQLHTHVLIEGMVRRCAASATPGAPASNMVELQSRTLEERVSEAVLWIRSTGRAAR